MSVELLNEHHLEFLRLKGGCTGSSESTLVKMPHVEIICHGSNDYTTLMYRLIHTLAAGSYCSIG